MPIEVAFIIEQGSARDLKIPAYGLRQGQVVLQVAYVAVGYHTIAPYRSAEKLEGE